MRNSGGRTKFKGSLRGDRKKAPREAGAKGARRLRSGSGAPTSGPRRSAVNRPKPASPISYDAPCAPFVLRTPRQKKHHRLETFVPLQRHLYGEERVFLPCPGSRR